MPAFHNHKPLSVLLPTIPTHPTERTSVPNSEGVPHPGADKHQKGNFYLVFKSELGQVSGRSVNIYGLIIKLSLTLKKTINIAGVPVLHMWNLI